MPIWLLIPRLEMFGYIVPLGQALRPAHEEPSKISKRNSPSDSVAVPDRKILGLGRMLEQMKLKEVILLLRKAYLKKLIILHLTQLKM